MANLSCSHRHKLDLLLSIMRYVAFYRGRLCLYAFTVMIATELSEFHLINIRTIHAASFRSYHLYTNTVLDGSVILSVYDSAVCDSVRSL